MNRQLHFFSLVRHEYRIVMTPWPNPANRIETIDFDRMNLPDKATSKRIKVFESKGRYNGSDSFQARRYGCAIEIRKFSPNGKWQRLQDIHFCARQWPKSRFDQVRFVEGLIREMAERVFGEEWGPEERRQADIIVRAVWQVIETPPEAVPKRAP